MNGCSSEGGTAWVGARGAKRLVCKGVTVFFNFCSGLAGLWARLQLGVVLNCDAGLLGSGGDRGGAKPSHNSTVARAPAKIGAGEGAGIALTAFQERG